MSELENIYLQSNTKYNNNYYIHLSAQKDGLTFDLSSEITICSPSCHTLPLSWLMSPQLFPRRVVRL